MSDVPEFKAFQALPSNISGPGGLAFLNMGRAFDDGVREHLKLVGRKEHYVSLSGRGDARMVAGLTREAIENMTLHETEHWARPEVGLLKFDADSQEKAATTALSTSNGEAWESRHKNVNSALRSRDAKSLFQGPMVETINQEIELLSQTPSGAFEIDGFTVARRLALRNVWKLLFGQAPKPGVDKNIDILLSRAMSVLVASLPRTWPFPYYGLSKSLRELYAWAKEIGDGKLATPDGSIASMMANRRENGELPSADKIYGDMTGLYITGRDGPASDITWTLFLLAAHPTHQNSLREELLLKPGYDSSLLAAIVNESRRLFPASYVLNPRICTEEHEFRGIKIPRGAMGFGSILARHHDPEVWPKARTYDPGRWLQPGFKPDRFDFIPFGLGKRRCVGDAFADLQTRIVVAEFIRRFHVGLDPRSSYDYKTVAILTQPKLGNTLRFVPRMSAPPPAVQMIKGNVHDLADLPR